MQLTYRFGINNCYFSYTKDRNFNFVSIIVIKMILKKNIPCYTDLKKTGEN